MLLKQNSLKSNLVKCNRKMEFVSILTSGCSVGS